MECTSEIMSHQGMVLRLHQIESELSYNIRAEKIYKMLIHMEAKHGKCNKVKYITYKNYLKCIFKVINDQIYAFLCSINLHFLLPTAICIWEFEV